MSSISRLLLGLFIIAHGLVHPILAAVPGPAPAGAPPVPGSFWTQSWLFGRGPAAKATLFIFTGVTALALLAAGLSLLNVLPGAWTPALWAFGAALSLATLVLFWHPWLVLGIVIDLAMLAAGKWAAASLFA